MDTVTPAPPEDFVTPAPRMDTGVASRNTGERSDFVTPEAAETPPIASRGLTEAQLDALTDDEA